MAKATDGSMTNFRDRVDPSLVKVATTEGLACSETVTKYQNFEAARGHGVPKSELSLPFARESYLIEFRVLRSEI